MTNYPRARGVGKRSTCVRHDKTTGGVDIRKERRAGRVDQTRGVIGVRVGQEHRLNVVWLDPSGREIGRQPPRVDQIETRRGRWGGLRADSLSIRSKAGGYCITEGGAW